MNTTHPQKPTPKVPTSLLEGWLPSLPAKLKPCFLARGAGVFVVKFRLPCPPNRRQLSSLSAALQNLLPRSIGQESFDSRQLFVNPVRNTALLTFWFPTGGSNEATFVATLNNYPATGFYSPGKVTAKPLPRGFAGNISGDYAEAVVEDFPHDAEPVASDRQLIKRARQAISHIFPGIVRIVLDPQPAPSRQALRTPSCSTSSSTGSSTSAF